MTTITPIQDASIASPPVRGLAARSAAGFGWNVTGGVFRAVAGVAINTVLARLLGPEPFGQLAMVMVAISLGNLVVESGMGTGLVQKTTVDEADVRYAFTLQMTAGLGLGLLLLTLAPLAAAATGQTEIAPLLRAMACTLPLQAFGQTAAALLRRNLDFQRLQQLQIASYLLGYLALGIPLALAGGGVWSLVWAQLAQVTVNSAGTWLLVRHSVRPLWSPRLGAMARFGVSITGGNIAAWAVGALPALLIGRFQGIAALGLYSRAFFVVGTPASVLASSLQTTTLTMQSRLRQHPRVAQRTYLGILTLSQLVAMPAFCAVAAMPGTVIEALFGARWSEAAPLLTPLALAMPLDCLAALSGPLLIARGRPGAEFWVQVITALSALVATGLLASQSTMPATAWGVLAGVYFVRAAASTVATIFIMDLPLAQWCRRLAVCAAAGAMVFGALHFLEGRLMDAGVEPWPRLVLLFLTAVGMTAAVARPLMGQDALRVMKGALAAR